jgi:glycosyltransferase involved in cell wall biosynthesis
MNVFYWIAGCLLGLAWLSRILDAARGMPTIADISLPQWDLHPKNLPRVSIIVPARNEEATIAPVLQQLLSLDYKNYEVIAVDDRSTDRTGEAMDQVAASGETLARLKIVHVEKLPPRWMGKSHAMWTAANAADGDWLLFTDADVFFKPDVLRRALAYGEAESADHVVLFPRMIMKSVGERMMISFFQTMFVFGHRPWKVADPKTKDHMGVGAFNLIRKSVYEAVGTYEALRFEVLDDMKLGKVVKTAGFAQRNVFGHDLISIRWGHGAIGIVNNVTKNFFAVMSFQTWRMLASSFAVGFLNLMPFVGIFAAHGWARLPFALALFCMFAIYVGMSGLSDVRPYYFLLHPFSSILFVYAMLRSMFLTLGQGGVVWRGTKYPLEELRRGLV